MTRLSTPAVALPRELRFRALLLHHGQRCLVRRGARLDVLEQLRQPAARFFVREAVLLGVHGADELVARGVELGTADVKPRRQQRHVVLRALDGRVRLHLDDLLLGLGKLRFGLLERILLVRRIELHDSFLGLDRRPGRDQRNDAQHPSDRRRHESHCAACTQLAGRMDRELQGTFDHARRRHRAAARRQSRHCYGGRSCGGDNTSTIAGSTIRRLIPPPHHLRAAVASRDDHPARLRDR